MIKIKDELKESLDAYIKEHHTQEESTGFIDGFTKAIEQLNILFVSERRELVITFCEWFKENGGFPIDNWEVNHYVDSFIKSNL